MAAVAIITRLVMLGGRMAASVRYVVSLAGVVGMSGQTSMETKIPVICMALALTEVAE